jgi:AraC-like DNA-binding protein
MILISLGIEANLAPIPLQLEELHTAIGLEEMLTQMGLSRGQVQRILYETEFIIHIYLQPS